VAHPQAVRPVGAEYDLECNSRNYNICPRSNGWIEDNFFHTDCNIIGITSTHSPSWSMSIKLNFCHLIDLMATWSCDVIVEDNLYIVSKSLRDEDNVIISVITYSVRGLVKWT